MISFLSLSNPSLIVTSLQRFSSTLAACFPSMRRGTESGRARDSRGSSESRSGSLTPGQHYEESQLYSSSSPLHYILHIHPHLHRLRNIEEAVSQSATCHSQAHRQACPKDAVEAEQEVLLTSTSTTHQPVALPHLSHLPHSSIAPLPATMALPPPAHQAAPTPPRAIESPTTRVTSQTRTRTPTFPA